jgi:glyoxylase-like metal-dependent hydrolase (beta-lactamase superfamily II)
VGLGDYTGVPLTDAARQWAESWDAARLSMPEQQCRVHVAHYITRGPHIMRIWEEKDPRTQEVIAIKHYISTYEQTRTIWMDGREHPPEYAPHTWMGFSTGRWDGDRLIVATTHIKQGWHRRNGVPASDRTTLTEHFIRHGNTLTHVAVITDPVYLTEPMVKSQHFALNPRSLAPQTWLWPCTAVVEVATREANYVAHFLPGKNPYLAPSREEAHLPMDGAQGGAETLYPEWLTNPELQRKRSVEYAPERPAERPDDLIQIWQIRDNVYMLVGAGANMTAHIGTDGVLLVDSKLQGSSENVLAALRSITDKPIRYVLNTHVHADHIGGNAALAEAGSTRTGGVVVRTIGGEISSTAIVLAHEKVLERLSTPSGTASLVPYEAWPTETFFNERRDFTFNDDGIVVSYLPNAHTDGDTIVFFRKADVIAVGDVFSTTAYPVIDLEHGGSVRGTLAALDAIIELAIPGVDHQAGTMIVPGHGRLSDEIDVVEFRDMLTIVRDRIADMIERGLSLEQVRAARPTFDFDPRYGAVRGPWTTTMFVDAVYSDLKAGAQR